MSAGPQDGGPDAVLVRSERRGPAVVVVLDAPATRNALSRALLGQLLAALQAAVHAAEVDPTVRVVVLTGAGPVFCSGADLREQAAGGGPGPVGLPEVVGACTVSGSADALVHMLASDIKQLERAIERVRDEPNVDHTRSVIVLSRLIDRPRP